MPTLRQTRKYQSNNLFKVPLLFLTRQNVYSLWNRLPSIPIRVCECELASLEQIASCLIVSATKDKTVITTSCREVQLFFVVVAVVVVVWVFSFVCLNSSIDLTTGTVRNK